MGNPLLSGRDVSGEYRRKLLGIGVQAAADEVWKFSPKTIQKLRGGEFLSDIDDDLFPSVSPSMSITLHDREIEIISMGVSQSVLAGIGLAEFELCSPAKQSADIFSQLETLPPEIIREVGNISEWSRGIIWARGRSAEISLSSCTFYELPNYSIVTDLATNYLPPKVFCAIPHPYALIENLYHESIHQAIFGSMDVDGLLGDGEPPDIWVPWHGTHWPMEQAFHAWLVYERVGRLRKLALRSNIARSIPELEVALEQALDCASYLRGEIAFHRHGLGPGGLRVLNEEPKQAGS